MHMPVKNRQRTTNGEDGSNSNMARLAAAAIREDNAKRLHGSIRSASTKTALTMVPITKPTCTALLNIDAIIGSKLSCTRSAGTTAEAENQRPSAETIANDAIAIDGSLPNPMPIRTSDLTCFLKAYPVGNSRRPQAAHDLTLMNTAKRKSSTSNPRYQIDKEVWSVFSYLPSFLRREVGIEETNSEYS